MNLLDRIRAQTSTNIDASAVSESRVINTKEEYSSSASSIDTDEDLFVLTDSPEKPKIPLGQQSYPLPDRALFLAIYESALRRPRFFNAQNFYTYKKWLLDGSCYVLNTFKAVDANALLALYLTHKPPDSVGALGPLSQLLWDIDLCVPEEYQRDFEQIIIDEGERMKKNFP